MPKRDGHPAEYRWRPLFNAAKFGWRPLLACSAVTLPRRETRWNLQGCPKLAKRSQPLVGRSSPYCGDIWRRYYCLTIFPIVDTCLSCENIAQFSVGGNDIEFVDEWPHLGHTVHDDKADIISKRNILRGQINNVMCFLVNMTQLLNCHSLEHIAAVLWQCHMGLNLLVVDAFCAIWRKGLRRVWNLPHNTHCELLPLLCGLLPLMDELARRCATFINGCLDSDCDVVNFVTRHGVYFRRILSPIGRNSLGLL